MTDRRSTGKNSKKVLMISLGVALLIVAVTMAIVMGKGKAEEENEEIDMKEPTRIAVEQMVEYGDDLRDKTFTIHTEDGKEEANFADLDPVVDTMTVGETEHQLDWEDTIVDVTIVVEDTQKPVLKGLKDVIELEGEEVDTEELKKLITAEDPVDGKLELTFEINEDKEGTYDVTAQATDTNGNKTSETFKVVLKTVVQAEKEEEIADKKDEEDKSSAVASKPKSDPTKPKQANPKQKEPKKEEPKQEKPRDETTKEEVYDCGENRERKFGNETLNFPPLNDPTGPLPSGASPINKSKSYHEYSYKQSIPGGGSITKVAASYENCYQSITILGTDDIGGSFISSYNADRDQISFTFIGERPSFADEDYIYVFYEVGRAFANAYGM